MNNKGKRQTKRVIISLKEWNGSLKSLKKRFVEHKISGLEEVLVVDKNGNVIRIFP